MQIDWQTKKLGEICDILDNQRKPVTQRDRISGNYPYYGATGVQDYVSDYIFDEKLILIGEDGAKWGAGENTAFIAEGKYWVNNHAHVIRPHRDKVLDNWIVYFLNVNDLSKYITGLTVQKLNQGKLRDIAIPMPPLSDQERILKILDEVFEKIQKAKKNTEKNLQNSRDLFESYSQSIFSDEKNKWDKKKLDEVCIVQRGSSPRPIKKFITDSRNGVNWIKIGDTKDIDRYLYSTNQKITKEGAKKSRLVKEGDLILSNSMSFGKPYIMKTTGYIHDGWFVLRPNSSLDTEYFYDVISSPQVQKQFISLASGAIVKNISGDLTKKAILPIPPLSEQKETVKKLNKLSRQTKKLEEIYKQKLDDLEELKKSILSKAFAGEL